MLNFGMILHTVLLAKKTLKYVKHIFYIKKSLLFRFLRFFCKWNEVVRIRNYTADILEIWTYTRWDSSFSLGWLWRPLSSGICCRLDWYIFVLSRSSFLTSLYSCKTLFSRAPYSVTLTPTAIGSLMASTHAISVPLLAFLVYYSALKM
jgi:hypothetical protein